MLEKAFRSSPFTAFGLTLVGLFSGLFTSLVVAATKSPNDADALFARPAHIAQAVDFWRRVYSEVDTQSGYIHDNRHPRIVYEVLPLDRGDMPRQQQRDIDRRIEVYKRILRDMAARPNEQYSPEQRRLADMWGPGVDKDGLRLAAKRVRFQRGQSERFQAGMERQEQLGPSVNSVLQKHGVPAALAALPHVESSYNPNVKSHAGALGLWQIMPATGKRYIKVTAKLDERLNVAKSTEAAARLLKHNYAVLGDWALAVTAYNRGLAGVRRAVREAGSADIGVISANYEGRGFGFASRNFYAAFLAAHDVSTGAHLNPEGANASVELQRYLAANLLAEEFALPLLALKKANPELDMRFWNGEKLLPKGSLRLPLKGFEESAVRSLEALYGVEAQHPDRYYRIQPGDKLALLARDMDLEMSHLMKLNGVRSVHRIYAGQILQLPTASRATNMAGISSEGAGRQPHAEFASLRSKAGLTDKASERSKRKQRAVSAMMYGVLEDSTAQADAVRYGYEAMRLSTPSVWDVRIAASIPTLAVIPDFFRRDATADFMLAGRNNDLPMSLQADPADYMVAANGSIEIQVGETIGHYAHWLGVSSRQLRHSNNLRKRQHVVVGRRLQLDFAATDRATFEWRRREYHESQQAQYFSNYRITGVEQHALGRGDNLWELATSEYAIPLWLLRQYNPDLDFASVLPLNAQLNIPVVTAKS